MAPPEIHNPASPDGRRRRRNSPELTRHVGENISVFEDGGTVPVRKITLTAGDQTFSVVERRGTPGVGILPGISGGYVIRDKGGRKEGNGSVYAVIVGDKDQAAKGSIDPEVLNIALDASVAKVVVYGGTFSVGDQGHVKNMVIAGPAEIFTPDGRNVDDYIAHRRIEGEGTKATINGTWVSQGPITHSPVVYEPSDREATVSEDLAFDDQSQASRAADPEQLGVQAKDVITEEIRLENGVAVDLIGVDFYYEIDDTGAVHVKSPVLGITAYKGAFVHAENIPPVKMVNVLGGHVIAEEVEGGDVSGIDALLRAKKLSGILVVKGDEGSDQGVAFASIDAIDGDGLLILEDNSSGQVGEGRVLIQGKNNVKLNGRKDLPIGSCEIFGRDRESVTVDDGAGIAHRVTTSRVFDGAALFADEVAGIAWIEGSEDKRATLQAREISGFVRLFGDADIRGKLAEGTVIFASYAEDPKRLNTVEGFGSLESGVYQVRDSRLVHLETAEAEDVYDAFLVEIGNKPRDRALMLFPHEWKYKASTGDDPEITTAFQPFLFTAEDLTRTYRDRDRKVPVREPVPVRRTTLPRIDTNATIEAQKAYWRSLHPQVEPLYSTALSDLSDWWRKMRDRWENGPSFREFLRGFFTG